MIRDAVASSSRAVLVAGAAAALTAATPAVAAAPPTGGVTPSSPTTTASASAEDRVAAPANASRPLRPEIRVTTARAAGLVGNRAVYAGQVVGAREGDRVRLDLRAKKSWEPVATARVSSSGRFRVAKQISSVGDRAARVRVIASEHVKSTHRRVKRVHGFRKAHASYFGPGLYGGPLACGGRLTPRTKGVAHKTLPCGTRVTLRYGKRQVTTKVVDRGPFIPGRDWDLTTATRNDLGFGDVGRVMVDH
ncbi:MAG: RlpA-like double-psi beta-barrel domain-containing protein [Patulibacter sp.]|nr:RlpA-like double-psi beta-barrel domain-containing protein [Patulibacter sp.]